MEDIFDHHECNCGHDHDHDCDCDHDHDHDCQCGHEHTSMTDLHAKIAASLALANDYCVCIEHCQEMEREDFVTEVLGYLPRLYWEFGSAAEMQCDDELYLPGSIDEQYYDAIRRGLESTMGEDDVFLETFEEDMKYSDTPISASISESLADIFQDLYNFVAAVRETQGELLTEAFAVCQENFRTTWSQTLCNVMRALNHLRYR